MKSYFNKDVIVILGDKDNFILTTGIIKEDIGDGWYIQTGHYNIAISDGCSDKFYNKNVKKYFDIYKHMGWINPYFIISSIRYSQISIHNSFEDAITYLYGGKDKLNEYIVDINKTLNKLETKINKMKCDDLDKLDIFNKDIKQNDIDLLKKIYKISYKKLILFKDDYIRKLENINILKSFIKQNVKQPIYKDNTYDVYYNNVEQSNNILDSLLGI